MFFFICCRGVEIKIIIGDKRLSFDVILVKVFCNVYVWLIDVKCGILICKIVYKVLFFENYIV